MTISLIKVLELPNLSRMATSTTQFESRDEISSRHDLYFRRSLFYEDLEQSFLLKSSNLLPCLLKHSLKTQKRKLKELDTMYENGIYICVS